jgi:thiol:disulfide interchange protein
MKNKIIIALIFILPFLVFGIIQGIKNTENTQSVAVAIERNPNTIILYKFYSPMCKDCLTQTKEFEKIKGKLPKEVFLEEVNVVENTQKNQKLIEEFNIMVVPSTVIVDNSGKIRKKSSSIMTSDEIMREIRSILEEK